MKIDKSRFKQIKETLNYVVYAEKDSTKEQREIIILYKTKGVAYRTIVSDKIFKLFLFPEEYKKSYINNNTKQRGK